MLVRGEGKGKGRGRGVSPDEVEDLEGVEAQLLRPPNSLGAQRATTSMAQGKVRELQAKEGELRRAGEEERGIWASGNVEKAFKKAQERKVNVDSWRGRWLGWRSR